MLFAALIASSLVAAVLLVKRFEGKYEASGHVCSIREYMEATRTGGGSRTVSYEWATALLPGGERYSGTDTIHQQPTTREATVYYMAANPRDNALDSKRLNRTALIAAGVALLIGIVAYWPLRRHYFMASAPPPLGREAGVGDSRGEYVPVAAFLCFK